MYVLQDFNFIRLNYKSLNFGAILAEQLLVLFDVLWLSKVSLKLGGLVFIFAEEVNIILKKPSYLWP